MKQECVFVCSEGQDLELSEEDQARIDAGAKLVYLPMDDWLDLVVAGAMGDREAVRRIEGVYAGSSEVD